MRGVLLLQAAIKLQRPCSRNWLIWLAPHPDPLPARSLMNQPAERVTRGERGPLAFVINSGGNATTFYTS